MTQCMNALLRDCTSALLQHCNIVTLHHFISVLHHLIIASLQMSGSVVVILPPAQKFFEGLSVKLDELEL